MKGISRIEKTGVKLHCDRFTQLAGIIEKKSRFFQKMGIAPDLNRTYSLKLNHVEIRNVAQIVDKLTSDYNFGDIFNGNYEEKPRYKEKPYFSKDFVFLFYRVPKGYAELKSRSEKSLLLKIFEGAYNKYLPKDANFKDLGELMRVFAGQHFLQDIALFYSNPMWFTKIPSFSLPLVKKVLQQRYDLILGIAQGANPIIHSIEYLTGKLRRMNCFTDYDPAYASLLFSTYNSTPEENRKLWGAEASRFFKKHSKLFVIDEIYDKAKTMEAFVELLHSISPDLNIDQGVVLTRIEPSPIFFCIHEEYMSIDWENVPQYRGSELIKSKSRRLNDTPQYSTLIDFVKTRLSLLVPSGDEYENMIFYHLLRLLPLKGLVWERPFPWLMDELEKKSLKVDGRLFEKIGEEMGSLVESAEFKNAYREEYLDYDCWRLSVPVLKASEEKIKYLERSIDQLLDHSTSRKLILNYLFVEKNPLRLRSLFDLINLLHANLTRRLREINSSAF